MQSIPGGAAFRCLDGAVTKGFNNIGIAGFAVLAESNKGMVLLDCTSLLARFVHERVGPSEAWEGGGNNEQRLGIRT